jgi:AcrR family transcriptional regulator
MNPGSDEGAGKRGRPRSEPAREAVLEATLDLLASEGFRGLTMKAVADRAGVARTTVYRWWPTKPALVREACWRLGQPAPVPDAGGVRDDVVAHLRALIEQAKDPRVIRISGEAAVETLRNPELDDLRRSLVEARRAPLRQALERAVTRKELPPDLDYELTMDLLTAPIVLRGLVTRGPLELQLAEQIVDRVLGPLSPPASLRTLHGWTRPEVADAGRQASQHGEVEER